MTQTQQEQALQVTNDYMPVMDISVAIARRNAVIDFVKRVMVDGVDYGKIPGTEKNTLMKAGAEKLSTLFGLVPEPEIIEGVTDWTGAQHGGEPFFYFAYRYHLKRNGVTVASADGSCNSMEKKYRYRWVPAHEAANMGIDVSTAAKQGGRISEFDFAIDKAETSGKYGKPADYWQQFKDGIQSGTAKKIAKKIKDGSTRDAWEIDSTLVRTPNPDIADLVNTIQKMAQKRALVAVVLLAVNASEFFTQDVEDMEFLEGNYRVVETKAEQKPAAQPASPPAAKQPDQPTAPPPPEPSTDPLGNTGQEADLSKTQADPVERISKHSKEATDLANALDKLGHSAEAAELLKRVNLASVAVDRKQSATTLHSHADNLKRIVSEHSKLIA